METIRQPKYFQYGFALSGGAARAFAHLGAIKALKENGILPDILSGTSAGALTAAFIADGYEAEEVLELFAGLSYRDFTDMALGQPALSKTTKLKVFLKKHLRARRFEDLKIPISVTLSDFYKGVPVHFSRGPLINPVVASCCIPIIFPPKVINGVHYVDGGLFQNIPVTPIRKYCEKIICINVNTIDNKPYRTLKDIVERTIFLVVRLNTIADKNLCDILIEPSQMVKYSLTDVHLSKEIFKVGYDAALECIKTEYQPVCIG